LQSTFGLTDSRGSLQTFLFIAIGIGVALRFVDLGGQSLWTDEMLTLTNAYVGEKMEASHVFGNIQGPFISLMMHFWASLSWNEYYLRLPFAIAGGLTVLSVYVLARYLAGSWFSLNTTFFMALAPIAVWYSQEVRGYAFVLLFTVLMTYFFVRWIDRHDRRSLVWYGVCIFAGLVSNLSAAFVVAGHFLYLVLVPGRRRLIGRWIVTVLVVLLVFSPWVRQIVVNVHLEKVVGAETGAPLSGGGPLTIMAIPYSAFTYSVGYSLGPAVRDLQTRTKEAIQENLHWIALALIVFAVPAGIGLRKLACENQDLLVLLLLSVGVPLVVVSVLALRNVKVFTPRYALVVLPAYALIVGRGLTEISRSRFRFFLLLFGGLLGFSLFNYFLVPAYAKDDARQTAATIMREFSAGDSVLAVFSSAPLSHYLKGFATVQTFKKDDLSSADAKAARCREIAGGEGRVWLSLCREWVVDPERSIKGWFDKNMIMIRHFNFPGIRLYLYEARGE
jgi:hypothetical protein